MQGNGAADGNAGERDFPSDAERIQKRNKVVDHGVDGEHAAHLLRQPGSTRVVAQDTALPGEQRRD